MIDGGAAFRRRALALPGVTARDTIPSTMHRVVVGIASALVLLAGPMHRAGAQASPYANGPLAAGDRLLVKIWLDTTFADTVRISQTGVAIFPRLGPLQVLGMSSGEIADSVRRAYSRVVRSPSVEVTPLRRITVVGEALRPATYYVESNATLRDAVALAGGITPIGTFGKITIIRDGRRSAYKHWEDRSDDDVLMHSGDIVWVDRDPWIKQNLFSVVSGFGVLVSIIVTLRR